MRFCLLIGSLALAAVAAGEGNPPATRITSVVHADPRSGRLVRTVSVRPVRSGESRPRARLDQYVEQTAEHFQVDPLLVHSVIQVESNYDPAAISPKGAQGLMQLMPDTARRFAVRDAFNPWENIEGGVRYLKYLQMLFGDDVRLALAAYNAGEGAVLKYGGIPPYAETTRYVDKVGRKLGEAKRAAEAKAQQERVNAPPAEAHVEAFEDSRGTLHLRTRSAP